MWASSANTEQLPLTLTPTPTPTPTLTLTQVWASSANAEQLPAGSSSRVVPLRAEQLLSPPPFKMSVAGMSVLSM